MMAAQKNTEKKYYAELVADLILVKGTIPTPRQLDKDPDITYKKVKEALGNYDKIIAAAREELENRGIEIDAFGKVKEKKKKQKFNPNPKPSTSRPTTVGESRNDKNQELPTPNGVIDRLVKLYSNEDVTMVALEKLYPGYSAEDILKISKVSNLNALEKIVDEAWQKNQKTAQGKQEKGGKPMDKNKELEKARRKKEKEQRTTEACKKVLREFALENKRWPTSTEINEFSKSRRLGWLSRTEMWKCFGAQKEWPSVIFPEGLPEDFIEIGRGQASAPKRLKDGVSAQEVEERPKKAEVVSKKAKAKDPKQSSRRDSKPKNEPMSTPAPEKPKDELMSAPEPTPERSKTPKDIFFNVVEELLTLANEAGGGEIALSMTAQLAGEKESVKLDFLIDTLE